jgi:hypothetical protein
MNCDSTKLVPLGDKEKKECRNKIEWEVKDDLRKSYEHLLDDIQEELLCHPERHFEENIIHAQKRLASVQVKSIIGMETLMKWAIGIASVSLIVSPIALLLTMLSAHK